jgi:hypothetical protein
VITVNRTGDTGPGLLDAENALNSVTLDDFTGGRVEEHGLDTEEGKGGCSGLGLGRSGKRTVGRKGQLEKEREGRNGTNVMMIEPVSVCQ